MRKRPQRLTMAIIQLTVTPSILRLFFGSPSSDSSDTQWFSFSLIAEVREPGVRQTRWGRRSGDRRTRSSRPALRRPSRRTGERRRPPVRRGEACPTATTNTCLITQVTGKSQIEATRSKLGGQTFVCKPKRRKKKHERMIMTSRDCERRSNSADDSEVTATRREITSHSTKLNYFDVHIHVELATLK